MSTLDEVDEAVNLLEKPKKLLATILIGNNFVNVGFVVISAFFVNSNFNFSGHSLLGFFVQVLLITFIILLLGEVTPKVYATTYAYKLTLLMSYPLFIMGKIFSPLSTILVTSTTFIDKRIAKKHSNITIDDLSHALEITRDEVTTEEDDKMFKGIVKFGETDVKQIMTPRLDVVAIEIGTTFENLKKIILDSGFSRLPVFKGDFDSIEGLIYIKDLLPYLRKDSDYKWRNLIRKPFVVPETKKIDDLLREFQMKKMHMAIVVDEYGGSSGIITLEDIIEEVVGEITDEFDDDKTVFTKLDDRNYVFVGKTPLNDFYRIIGVEGDIFEQANGEADTVAGFIIELTGKIPLKNERISFGDYIFKVEASDKRRVKQGKVTLPEQDSSQSKSNSSGGQFNIFLMIICFSGFLLTSCTETYMPKPKGFFRINLPEHEYNTYLSGCPFVFEYATNAIVDTTESHCNLNIIYPLFNCKLYMTYFDIDDTLREYIEDSRTLAMKHIVKASGIEETPVIFDEHQVYGLVYQLEGNAASSCQFYLTDSIKHFIRGALYFNARPNADSTAPVEKYMEEDISHLISTLKWVD